MPKRKNHCENRHHRCRDDRVDRDFRRKKNRWQTEKIKHITRTRPVVKSIRSKYTLKWKAFENNAFYRFHIRFGFTATLSGATLSGTPPRRAVRVGDPDGVYKNETAEKMRETTYPWFPSVRRRPGDVTSAGVRAIRPRDPNEIPYARVYMPIMYTCDDGVGARPPNKPCRR